MASVIANSPKDGAPQKSNKAIEAPSSSSSSSNSSSDSSSSGSSSSSSSESGAEEEEVDNYCYRCQTHEHSTRLCPNKGTTTTVAGGSPATTDGRRSVRIPEGEVRPQLPDNDLRKHIGGGTDLRNRLNLPKENLVVQVPTSRISSDEEEGEIMEGCSAEDRRGPTRTRASPSRSRPSLPPRRSSRDVRSRSPGRSSSSSRRRPSPPPSSRRLPQDSRSSTSRGSFTRRGESPRSQVAKNDSSRRSDRKGKSPASSSGEAARKNPVAASSQMSSWHVIQKAFTCPEDLSASEPSTRPVSPVPSSSISSNPPIGGHLSTVSLSRLLATGATTGICKEPNIVDSSDDVTPITYSMDSSASNVIEVRDFSRDRRRRLVKELVKLKGVAEVLPLPAKLTATVTFPTTMQAINFVKSHNARLGGFDDRNCYFLLEQQEKESNFVVVTITHHQYLDPATLGLCREVTELTYCLGRQVRSQKTPPSLVRSIAVPNPGGVQMTTKKDVTDFLDDMFERLKKLRAGNVNVYFILEDEMAMQLFWKLIRNLDRSLNRVGMSDTLMEVVDHFAIFPQGLLILEPHYYHPVERCASLNDLFFDLLQKDNASCGDKVQKISKKFLTLSPFVKIWMTPYTLLFLDFKFIWEENALQIAQVGGRLCENENNRRELFVSLDLDRLNPKLRPNMDYPAAKFNRAKYVVSSEYLLLKELLEFMHEHKKNDIMLFTYSSYVCFPILLPSLARYGLLESFLGCLCGAADLAAAIKPCVLDDAVSVDAALKRKLWAEKFTTAKDDFADLQKSALMSTRGLYLLTLKVRPDLFTSLLEFRALPVEDIKLPKVELHFEIRVGAPLLIEPNTSTEVRMALPKLQTEHDAAVISMIKSLKIGVGPPSNSQSDIIFILSNQDSSKTLSFTANQLVGVVRMSPFKSVCPRSFIRIWPRNCQRAFGVEDEFHYEPLPNWPVKRKSGAVMFTKGKTKKRKKIVVRNNFSRPVTPNTQLLLLSLKIEYDVATILQFCLTDVSTEKVVSFQTFPCSSSNPESMGYFASGVRDDLDVHYRRRDSGTELMTSKLQAKKILKELLCEGSRPKVIIGYKILYVLNVLQAFLKDFGSVVGYIDLEWCLPQKSRPLKLPPWEKLMLLSGAAAAQDQGEVQETDVMNRQELQFLKNLRNLTFPLTWENFVTVYALDREALAKLVAKEGELSNCNLLLPVHLESASTSGTATATRPSATPKCNRLAIVDLDFTNDHIAGLKLYLPDCDGAVHVFDHLVPNEKRPRGREESTESEMIVNVLLILAQHLEKGEIPFVFVVLTPEKMWNFLSAVTRADMMGALERVVLGWIDLSTTANALRMGKIRILQVFQSSQQHLRELHSSITSDPYDDGKGKTTVMHELFQMLIGGNHDRYISSLRFKTKKHSYFVIHTSISASGSISTLDLFTPHDGKHYFCPIVPHSADPNSNFHQNDAKEWMFQDKLACKPLQVVLRELVSLLQRNKEKFVCLFLEPMVGILPLLRGLRHFDLEDDFLSITDGFLDMSAAMSKLKITEGKFCLEEMVDLGNKTVESNVQFNSELCHKHTDLCWKLFEKYVSSQHQQQLVMLPYSMEMSEILNSARDFHDGAFDMVVVDKAVDSQTVSCKLKGWPLHSSMQEQRVQILPHDFIDATFTDSSAGVDSEGNCSLTLKTGASIEIGKKIGLAYTPRAWAAIEESTKVVNQSQSQLETFLQEVNATRAIEVSEKEYDNFTDVEFYPFLKPLAKTLIQIHKRQNKPICYTKSDNLISDILTFLTSDLDVVEEVFENQIRIPGLPYTHDNVLRVIKKWPEVEILMDEDEVSFFCQLLMVHFAKPYDVSSDACTSVPEEEALSQDLLNDDTVAFYNNVDSLTLTIDPQANENDSRQEVPVGHDISTPQCPENTIEMGRSQVSIGKNVETPKLAEKKVKKPRKRKLKVTEEESTPTKIRKNMTTEEVQESEVSKNAKVQSAEHSSPVGEDSFPIRDIEHLTLPFDPDDDDARKELKIGTIIEVNAPKRKLLVLVDNISSSVSFDIFHSSEEPFLKANSRLLLLVQDEVTTLGVHFDAWSQYPGCHLGRVTSCQLIKGSAVVEFQGDNQEVQKASVYSDRLVPEGDTKLKVGQEVLIHAVKKPSWDKLGKLGISHRGSVCFRKYPVAAMRVVPLAKSVEVGAIREYFKDIHFCDIEGSQKRYLHMSCANTTWLDCCAQILEFSHFKNFKQTMQARTLESDEERFATKMHEVKTIQLVTLSDAVTGDCLVACNSATLVNSVAVERLLDTFKEKQIDTKENIVVSTGMEKVGGAQSDDDDDDIQVIFVGRPDKDGHQEQLQQQELLQHQSKQPEQQQIKKPQQFISIENQSQNPTTAKDPVQQLQEKTQQPSAATEPRKKIAGPTDQQPEISIEFGFTKPFTIKQGQFVINLLECPVRMADFKSVQINWGKNKYNTAAHLICDRIMCVRMSYKAGTNQTLPPTRQFGKIFYTNSQNSAKSSSDTPIAINQKCRCIFASPCRKVTIALNQTSGGYIFIPDAAPRFAKMVVGLEMYCDVLQFPKSFLSDGQKDGVYFCESVALRCSKNIPNKLGAHHHLVLNIGLDLESLANFKWSNILKSPPTKESLYQEVECFLATREPAASQQQQQQKEPTNRPTEICPAVIDVHANKPTTAAVPTLTKYLTWSIKFAFDFTVFQHQSVFKLLACPVTLNALVSSHINLSQKFWIHEQLIFDHILCLRLTCKEPSEKIPVKAGDEIGTLTYKNGQPAAISPSPPKTESCHCLVIYCYDSFTIALWEEKGSFVFIPASQFPSNLRSLGVKVLCQVVRLPHSLLDTLDQKIRYFCEFIAVQSHLSGPLTVSQFNHTVANSLTYMDNMSWNMPVIMTFEGTTFRKMVEGFLLQQRNEIKFRHNIRSCLPPPNQAIDPHQLAPTCSFNPSESLNSSSTLSQNVEISRSVSNQQSNDQQVTSIFGKQGHIKGTFNTTNAQEIATQKKNVLITIPLIQVTEDSPGRIVSGSCESKDPELGRIPSNVKSVVKSVFAKQCQRTDPDVAQSTVLESVTQNKEELFQETIRNYLPTNQATVAAPQEIDQDSGKHQQQPAKRQTLSPPGEEKQPPEEPIASVQQQTTTTKPPSPQPIASEQPQQQATATKQQLQQQTIVAKQQQQQVIVAKQPPQQQITTSKQTKQEQATAAKPIPQQQANATKPPQPIASGEPQQLPAAAKQPPRQQANATKPQQQQATAAKSPQQQVIVAKQPPKQPIASGQQLKPLIGSERPQQQPIKPKQPQQQATAARQPPQPQTAVTKPQQPIASEQPQQQAPAAAQQGTAIKRPQQQPIALGQTQQHAAAEKQPPQQATATKAPPQQPIATKSPPQQPMGLGQPQQQAAAEKQPPQQQTTTTKPQQSIASRQPYQQAAAEKQPSQQQVTATGQLQQQPTTLKQPLQQQVIVAKQPPQQSIASGHPQQPTAAVGETPPQSGTAGKPPMPSLLPQQQKPLEQHLPQQPTVASQRQLQSGAGPIATNEPTKKGPTCQPVASSAPPKTIGFDFGVKTSFDIEPQQFTIKLLECPVKLSEFRSMHICWGKPKYHISAQLICDKVLCVRMSHNFGQTTQRISYVSKLGTIYFASQNSAERTAAAPSTRMEKCQCIFISPCGTVMIAHGQNSKQNILLPKTQDINVVEGCEFYCDVIPLSKSFMCEAQKEAVYFCQSVALRYSKEPPPKLNFETKLVLNIEQSLANLANFYWPCIVQAPGTIEQFMTARVRAWSQQQSVNRPAVPVTTDSFWPIKFSIHFTVERGKSIFKLLKCPVEMSALISMDISQGSEHFWIDAQLIFDNILCLRFVRKGPGGTPNVPVEMDIGTLRYKSGWQMAKENPKIESCQCLVVYQCASNGGTIGRNEEKGIIVFIPSVFAGIGVKLLCQVVKLPQSLLEAMDKKGRYFCEFVAVQCHETGTAPPLPLSHSNFLTTLEESLTCMVNITWNWKQITSFKGTNNRQMVESFLLEQQRQFRQSRKVSEGASKNLVAGLEKSENEKTSKSEGENLVKTTTATTTIETPFTTKISGTKTVTATVAAAATTTADATTTTTSIAATTTASTTTTTATTTAAKTSTATTTAAVTVATSASTTSANATATLKMSPAENITAKLNEQSPVQICLHFPGRQTYCYKFLTQSCHMGNNCKSAHAFPDHKYAPPKLCPNYLKSFCGKAPCPSGEHFNWQEINAIYTSQLTMQRLNCKTCLYLRQKEKTTGEIPPSASSSSAATKKSIASTTAVSVQTANAATKAATTAATATTTTTTATKATTANAFLTITSKEPPATPSRKTEAQEMEKTIPLAAHSTSKSKVENKILPTTSCNSNPSLTTNSDVPTERSLDPKATLEKDVGSQPTHPTLATDKASQTRNNAKVTSENLPISRVDSASPTIMPEIESPHRRVLLPTPSASARMQLRSGRKASETVVATLDPVSNMKTSIISANPNIKPSSAAKVSDAADLCTETVTQTPNDLIPSASSIVTPGDKNAVLPYLTRSASKQKSLTKTSTPITPATLPPITSNEDSSKLSSFDKDKADVSAKDLTPISTSHADATKEASEPTKLGKETITPRQGDSDSNTKTLKATSRQSESKATEAVSTGLTDPPNIKDPEKIATSEPPPLNTDSNSTEKASIQMTSLTQVNLAATVTPTPSTAQQDINESTLIKLTQQVLPEKLPDNKKKLGPIKAIEAPAATTAPPAMSSSKSAKPTVQDTDNATTASKLDVAKAKEPQASKRKFGPVKAVEAPAAAEAAVAASVECPHVNYPPDMCKFHFNSRKCKYNDNCKEGHYMPPSMRKSVCVPAFRKKSCDERCNFKHHLSITKLSELYREEVQRLRDNCLECRKKKQRDLDLIEAGPSSYMSPSAKRRKEASARYESFELLESVVLPSPVSARLRVQRSSEPRGEGGRPIGKNGATCSHPNYKAEICKPYFEGRPCRHGRKCYHSHHIPKPFRISYCGKFMKCVTDFCPAEHMTIHQLNLRYQECVQNMRASCEICMTDERQGRANSKRRHSTDYDTSEQRSKRVRRNTPDRRVVYTPPNEHHQQHAYQHIEYQPQIECQEQMSGEPYVDSETTLLELSHQYESMGYRGSPPRDHYDEESLHYARQRDHYSPDEQRRFDGSYYFRGEDRSSPEYDRHEREGGRQVITTDNRERRREWGDDGRGRRERTGSRSRETGSSRGSRRRWSIQQVPCLDFNTVQGCHRGNDCPYLH